ncbi:MAG: hypothetical protein IKD00_02800 [Candidatus Methanomethylophilaceae archaeon]|nr:hypothetical protein [Candidatus Methanomethylophilaceae archaeon]
MIPSAIRKSREFEIEKPPISREFEIEKPPISREFEIEKPPISREFEIEKLPVFRWYDRHVDGVGRRTGLRTTPNVWNMRK